MSNKKFVVFLSLLAVLSMLLSACQPATAHLRRRPLQQLHAACCGRRAV